MKKNIETPTIRDILYKELMVPYNISVYRLAKDIDVPISRIQEILKGKRRITADTSLRLDKYFGFSEGYFFRIQNDIDLRNAKLKIKKNLNNIHCVIA
ncbi:MAG: HigA family addiction module antitoxin [Coriobacteriia bacterium]|nr:HigA family addiction module antitoxin [Coriobacteriia bacterium]